MKFLFTILFVIIIILIYLNLTKKIKTKFYVGLSPQLKYKGKGIIANRDFKKMK